MLERIGTIIESNAHDTLYNRLNRRQFFTTWLGLLLGVGFINNLILKVVGDNASAIAYVIVNLILLCFSVAVYWFALAPAILHRLHDTNKNGKTIVGLFLIAYTLFAIFSYGSTILIDNTGIIASDASSIVSTVVLIFGGLFLVFFLYLLFAPGTTGDNAFGPEAPDTWIFPKQQTSTPNMPVADKTE